MIVDEVILVNILKDIVNSMSVSGIEKVYYQAGRSSQIIENLTEIDESVFNKDTKYPFIGLLMPFTETFGSGVYCTARIGKIIIATISNDSDKVLKRYEDGGTFKSVLYPCMREFFKQLALSTFINIGDPNGFVFKKQDNPGIQPIGADTNDYIDSIHILDLELPLLQNKIC